MRHDTERGRFFTAAQKRRILFRFSGGRLFGGGPCFTDNPFSVYRFKFRALKSKNEQVIFFLLNSRQAEAYSVFT
jgi:hypothetical protein